MIHTYSFDGAAIALDVESGAVHMLDELAFALLSLADPAANRFIRPTVSDELAAKYGALEIEETISELEALADEGLLFSPPADVEARFSVEDAPVKAMCLHIAHDCNLRCEYCFAGTGNFHGDRALMSADTAKAAIDFLIKNSHGRRNLEVDFFGGEPLMNFDVIRETVDYAREREAAAQKNFRFTVTTNGVLLGGDKLAYINENMDNLVLSLDGRAEVNDRVRKTTAGGGSYERILPGFINAADLRNQDRYYVRGTFTAYNTDFDRDVLHLADLGFRQISVEPVVAPPDASYALTEEHLPEVFESYERLAREMIKRREEGRGFNFFHFMIDLDQGPCIIKRISGCGAGCEYVAVTPEGDVYPCHQFVGMEDFKLGSLAASEELDRDIRRNFAAATVTGKSECAACWAKYYCSGGCSANNHLYGGGIMSPYRIGCEMEKKRVELAIALKVLAEI